MELILQYTFLDKRRQAISRRDEPYTEILG